MRVIALGGAGAMGRLTVKDLASRTAVEELAVADCNIAAARALAGELGPQCTYLKVDVDNHAKLVGALRGYDVALGAVGPFYKYEVKMARACIEAGAHYVSICDDNDAAVDVLQLDGEARAAEVTMITGVGWTPGVTNVLARKASSCFDEVDEVAVSWGCHSGDTEGKAVIYHTLHIFHGAVPSFQGGRRVMVPAGSGKERVRFPEPVGDVYVYNLGHPEPVTIPRYINARTVTLKGGFADGIMAGMTMLGERMHLYDTPRRMDMTVWYATHVLTPLARLFYRPRETCSACRVDVTGKKAGRWGQVVYGAAAHMDLLTGLPPSVAIQMLGEGKVKEKGVMAPEACLEPREFLTRLAEDGIRLYEGEEMSEPLRV
ncbi:MAG: saccharopine dehydrogenase [Actinobacteria bacterium]|jgi:saccharopine dehydrogenase-like NADP-dependent oxidoreductase|nr:MAG: saccharopine dehydrogenase [Actinomycetota bacterium]